MSFDLGEDTNVPGHSSPSRLVKPGTIASQYKQRLQQEAYSTDDHSTLPISSVTRSHSSSKNNNTKNKSKNHSYRTNNSDQYNDNDSNNDDYQENIPYTQPKSQKSSAPYPPQRSSTDNHYRSSTNERTSSNKVNTHNNPLYRPPSTRSGTEDEYYEPEEPSTYEYSHKYTNNKVSSNSKGQTSTKGRNSGGGSSYAAASVGAQNAEELAAANRALLVDNMNEADK